MENSTKDPFKLPPDAMQFAKKMGIDLTGLEPEAEDIWKMLENMANTNPSQYQDFVKQQFENSKDDVQNGAATKRSLRPTGK